MTNSQVLYRTDIKSVPSHASSTDMAKAEHSTLLPVVDAVTVRRDEPIGRAIRLLNRSRLSTLPVVDARGALIGLITEGDLLTRLTSRKRSWWATLFADNQVLIQEYRKAAGTTVGEVMGLAPTPVPAGASAQEAADLLAEQGLRELPVVADGRVVGMITRPAILALLELCQRPTGQATDAELVAAMNNRLHEEPWVTNRGLWVEATRGVLFLAGMVENKEEQAALETMARAIPGCTGVDNHTCPRTVLRGRWA